MSRQAMITTFDNPFDPVDQFKEWWLWDEHQGYGTCSYLDRVSHTSDALSDQENYDEIERAINEIIEYNPTMYRKIVIEVDDDTGEYTRLIDTQRGIMPKETLVSQRVEALS